MLGKITTLTQQLIKTSLLTPNYNYVIFISLVNLIKCHAHENAMHVCYENASLTILSLLRNFVPEIYIPTISNK